LRQVANSYLWLLIPSLNNNPILNNASIHSNVVYHNLMRYCELFGISGKRILFADRIAKAMHIERYAAADLFLDSFIYSAHSTATDSLRGVKSDPNYYFFHLIL
jgi:protein O-GlcNAc transferase